MPFELANKFTHKHLIPQAADLALDPPESYFYIQDGLIISCGVLYALCYFFYIIRTYRDKHISGSVLYLAGTLSYELFYALTIPTSTVETLAFSIWFLIDLAFALTALFSAYRPQERTPAAAELFIGFLAGILVLYSLFQIYPDERGIQETAYWTGILLQLPIGWAHVWLLVQKREIRGQGLEIWATRYLRCFTAYGVFFWRYWNAPQNWAYVGSVWSVGIVVVTLIPETLYPFVYIWVSGEVKDGKDGKNKVE